MKTKDQIMLLAALLGVAATTGLRAQGTAFTYQGRLDDNGSPASGIYDLRFTIYDAGTGGSVVAGPITNSAVGVSNGLFTATLDFGSDVFTGPERWLEISVSTNGANHYFTLTPRQPLTPAPYAMYSANAGAAAIASSVTAGSITADQLAPGAAAANLNADGQSGVASGGIILATNASDTNLLNAGYVKLGSFDLGNDHWQQLASGAAPPAGRYGHTAVWTGSEMIVWGGYNGSSFFNDGARYNPAANSWTTINTNGAPAARAYHTAVWTGNEMIIWGGLNGSLLNDGGRYNPASDSWTAVSTNGAPAGRDYHTAVWTGSEMMVWGGWGGTNVLNDGGRYNPVTDSWTPVATNGAPAGRDFHTAVWTGSEMIVWGGYSGSSFLNDGGQYSPVSNSWTSVTTNGAPAARDYHTAVWTGTNMIVWGGAGIGNNRLNDGGRYNPASDSWTPVTTNGAPAGRAFHTAVWTGSEMIVWGGAGSKFIGLLNDGGRYNPASDSWAPVTTSDAPPARSHPTSVWTGSEMIVWGGAGAGSYSSDGGRYDPVADSWTSTDTPAGRILSTTVWTGSEMIVWGGTDGSFSSAFNDGGRYDPAANSWQPVTTTGAPSVRVGHTAVWTGSEMIVWGGGNPATLDTNALAYLNDGGRYNPVTDTWQPVTTNGAPAGRSGHTAVWTGTEMIVWGGHTAYYAYDANNQIVVDFAYFNDGGRYNPATDSWQPVTAIGAPTGRAEHVAVWTGSEMIVWGGAVQQPFIAPPQTYLNFNDGGRYNPATDTWTPITTTGAPLPRGLATAVWTGNEMIVWGGFYHGGLAGAVVGDGGRYNPVTDSWQPVTTNGVPAARVAHTAVWTGSEMIVWGGEGETANALNDGGRYNPASDAWSAMTIAGAPAARAYPTAVWTGNAMIVWGGEGPGGGPYGVGGLFKDTFSYVPSRVVYLYQRP